MGMSDYFLIPEMAGHFAKRLRNLPEDSRIAWLGQKHPAMGNTNLMYRRIKSLTNIRFEEDFYDLHNDETVAHNSYIWDVNSEWDLQEYDLVIACRIFYACESASQLLRNIKKTISSGQVLIADFMSGNTGSQHINRDKNEIEFYTHAIDNVEVFWKPDSSRSILPMLIEVWQDFKVDSTTGGYQFGVIPNHEDQVITERDILEKGVNSEWYHSFRDPMKGRIYSIGEFTKL